MKPGKVSTPVIIGQPWQRAYNGIPNWRREGINFESDGARLFAPFISDEDFTTDDESDEEDIHETTKGKEQTPQTSQPPGQVPQIQSPAKPKTHSEKAIWLPKKLHQAQQGHSKIWVPKKAVKRFQQTSTSNATTNRQRNKTTHVRRQRKEPTRQPNNQRKSTLKSTAKQATNLQQRWIPKHVLKAQNYYKGSSRIWLQKSVNLQSPTPLNKQVTTSAELYQPQPKTNQRWISKPVLHNQGYYEGTKHIWLPKITQPSTLHLESDKSWAPALPKQTSQRWVPKTSQQVTNPKQAPSTTNKARSSVTKPPAKKWIPKDQPRLISKNTSHITPTVTSNMQEEVTKQVARATLSKYARQVIYLLLTLQNDKFAQLWQTYATALTGSTYAASTAEALGPYLLQDPSLAPH